MSSDVLEPVKLINSRYADAQKSKNDPSKSQESLIFLRASAGNRKFDAVNVKFGVINRIVGASNSVVGVRNCVWDVP
jgi:hypothetical protein